MTSAADDDYDDFLENSDGSVDWTWLHLCIGTLGCRFLCVWVYMCICTTTEIDSPNENAKTLYNILTDGTKALKFVNRREVDLTWRNPVGICLWMCSIASGYMHAELINHCPFPG